MISLDPRLVELYDQDNPDGPDHDYFRALADRLAARTVVDLGCGTGMLTVTLARSGRHVIGVDPDAAMLGFARSRSGGEAVDWVHGDSRSIGAAGADLVVMSGNVAQAITGDAWLRTLSDIGRALRPGGTVAFESRNPVGRAWEPMDPPGNLGPERHRQRTTRGVDGCDRRQRRRNRGHRGSQHLRGI